MSHKLTNEMVTEAFDIIADAETPDEFISLEVAADDCADFGELLKDAEQKRPRWFNTSPLFDNFPSFGPRVDHELGAIRDVAVVTTGEAKGHGVQLDRAFVARVVELGQEAAHGIKCRFGHPTASGSAMGDYLGRATNFRIDQDNPDIGRCDVFLDDVANKSPRGKLKDWVMAMAEKNSDMFGTSIVFSPGDLIPPPPLFPDPDAPDGPVEPGDGGDVDFQNMPVATIKALNAVDLVDDPAANPDGLFSTGGELLNIDQNEQIAAQVTTFLEANPRILEIIERKPEVIAGYLRRFKAYQARRADTFEENQSEGADSPVAPDVTLEELTDGTENKDKTMGKTLKNCPADSEEFGASLARTLNNRIDEMEDDETSRADIIEGMGSAADISAGTVNDILAGDINCPPLERLEAFASFLDLSVDTLTAAAREDGCSYGEDADEEEEMASDEPEEVAAEAGTDDARESFARIGQEFGADILAEAVEEDYSYEEAHAAFTRGLVERVAELEAENSALRSIELTEGPEPVTFDANGDVPPEDPKKAAVYEKALNACGKEGVARFAANLKLRR